MVVGCPMEATLGQLGLLGQKMTKGMEEDVKKLAEGHREAHMQVCRDQARKNLYFL